MAQKNNDNDKTAVAAAFARLEKEVIKLKKSFDLSLKALKDDLAKLSSTNSKLVRQNQINSRKILSLEKRLLQKDLDMNQLRGEINRIASKK